MQQSHEKTWSSSLCNFLHSPLMFLSFPFTSLSRIIQVSLKKKLLLQSQQEICTYIYIYIKIKMSVSMQCTHEGEGVQLYSSLNSALNGLDWLTSHPSHFTHRKVSQYALNRMLGWPQRQSECYREERKICYPYLDSNPRPSSP